MNASDAPTMDEFIDRLWADRNLMPQETIDRVTALLTNDTAGLANHSTARLHASRAVAHARQGRPTEAAMDVAEAERLLGPAIQEDPELEFELRRVKGRSAMFMAQETEALKLLLKNLELATAIGSDYMLGLAHSDVATVYGISGNVSRTLEHLQLGLRHTPEAESDRYGALLNNLGNIYLKLNRIEEGLACFIRAQEAFAKDGNALQVAISRSNEARALTELGEYDRGIAVQSEAIELFDAGGYGSYVSASHFKLADTHHLAGNLADAEKHYLLSIEIAHQPGNGTYTDDAHAAYGAFLLEQDRSLEAVEHYSKAVEVTKGRSANANYATHLENLIAAQEAAGQTGPALASLKELVAIRDAMDTEEASRGHATAIAELEQSLEREVEIVRVTARALVEANKRLAEQSRELVELASTDHLTGLRNRRYFSQKLKRALRGTRQEDALFSVIFMDVDMFKEINDTFGHEKGDLVLQAVSSVLTTSLRQGDTLARWGGEEFAVLLAGADRDNAHAIATKLVSNIGQFDWSQLAPGLRVTISAGVISSSECRAATPTTSCAWPTNCSTTQRPTGATASFKPVPPTHSEEASRSGMVAPLKSNTLLGMT